MPDGVVGARSAVRKCLVGNVDGIFPPLGNVRCPARLGGLVPPVLGAFGLACRAHKERILYSRICRLRIGEPDSGVRPSACL